MWSSLTRYNLRSKQQALEACKEGQTCHKPPAMSRMNGREGQSRSREVSGARLQASLPTESRPQPRLAARRWGSGGNWVLQ